jgi:hypothetical protein
MEQDDAAVLAVDVVQDAIGDRVRERVGPVEGIDVPQDRLQVRGAQELQTLLVARTAASVFMTSSLSAAPVSFASCAWVKL